jgi:perosamine synthetase
MTNLKDSKKIDNEKMNDWKIPLYKIYSDDEDLNLITKIIRRGTKWAIGPEIHELEQSLSDYVGTDYAVTFNSGTSGLHAILLSYEIKKDDEVIVPSFSFISTANSVLFVGGTPKFADIETTNYGLDPISIKEKISSKSKAIIPMDYGGLPCRIQEIKNVAAENNLILIEDAAEALGSSINNVKTGSVADSSIFSFCGNKVLTTGEGGAVVTNSEKIYEKLKLIRSHGRLDKTSYFDDPLGQNYLELGYNWRMSSITAALGITQLQKLDKLISMRRNNAHYISERISKHDLIEPPHEPDGFFNIYQMYSIKLANKILRDSLQNFLLSKKIFCKVYFDPIHLTEFYKKNFQTKKGDFPKTESISENLLTLPLYPNMTLEEKNYLIESINEFFE